MINLKKRLSVNLAKTIEQPLKEFYGLYIINDHYTEGLLHITDNEIKPNLFFTILKETHDNSGHRINFNCKPYNSSINTSKASSAKIEGFEKVIRRWLENLKYYEEDSVLNDPIIRGYQDEFYNDFKIVDDEEADTKGFAYVQQIQLSNFFGKIVKEIEGFKDDNNKNLVEELKQDAIYFQDTVASETKNGFMRKFSLFLAKSRKGSMMICKYILIEFSKDFLKSQTKLIFNYTLENINKLPEYFIQLVDKT